MKLKTLLDVLTDTQTITICTSNNDDFEIHATTLDSIPEKLLVTMWDSDVTGIFTDEGTMIVVLKGDDDDDESLTS